MRPLLICLAICTPVAVFGAGSGAQNVGGTARAGVHPLADAVVWLEPLVHGPNLERPRPVLDQRNLGFAPRVLAVQVGTTVEFPNNDRVFHNVFSFRDGKRFDLGIYPVGAKKLVHFDRPGVSRLFCNIHPDMAAYVVAVDSPLFAVSGRDGTFTIDDVPEGRYTFHAWSAGRGERSGSFSTQSGAPLRVDWP